MSAAIAEDGAAEMKSDDQMRKLTEEELEALIDNSWEELENENVRAAPKRKAKRVVVTSGYTSQLPLLLDPRDVFFGWARCLYSPRKWAVPIGRMELEIENVRAAPKRKAKQVPDSTTGPKRMAGSTGAGRLPDSTTGVRNTTEHRLSKESVPADRVPKHGDQEEDGVGWPYPHHQMRAHDGDLPQSGGDDAEREKIDDETPQETSTKHVLNAKKHTME